MGTWHPDPDHQAWEHYRPDAAGDWPADAPEQCACWGRGCELTRHPVTLSDDNPDAEPVQAFRYEIFHARPPVVPRLVPDRAGRADRKRHAAGDRDDR